ncbi:hypothetical protein COV15_02295 [Candidatus Woesearchaeota archaeon CG10_big_fil_rev_8_21_14_0_10_34_12]|nr:MAG: hypothetical protein COV15_02295 [Candidatus Woesearchaeota archaeon CG10_big_fil_rev_8_21_14_0_10_34_12]
MKKILISAVIVMMLSLSNIMACTHSTDSFASEVLLNKPGIDYHLNFIKNADNVLIKDNGEYIFKSRSEELYTILKEVDGKLSVRLQIPVRTKYVNQNYIKIIKTAKAGEIVTNLSGWNTECAYSSCVFKKDDLSVMTNKISEDKYTVTIEIRNDIKNCISGACNGKCMYYSEETFCIPQNYVDELKNFVISTEISPSIDTLLSGAEVQKIAYFGEDLVPELEMTIDWPEAMKNELTFLKSSAIIGITNKEIDDISNLAEQGKAGDNLKIIYGEDRNKNKGWFYYYETKSPIIQKPLNCEEYPLSEIPSKYIIFNKNADTFYYALPVALVTGVIALFFILLLISRVMENIKKNKSVSQHNNP